MTQSAFDVGGIIFYGGIASAGFRESSSDQVPGCTITETGNCTVTRCVQPDAETDAGFSNAVSAGSVAIAGTTVDGGILMEPSGTNEYSQVVQGQLWTGGETLSASSTGQMVPAFSNKTLVAPSDIVVTAPTCTAGACGTISRTTPFTATWTGGGPGTVNVYLASSQATPMISTSLVCTFPASAGTGTIEPATLATLLATPGSLAMSNQRSTDFTAGDYAVTFTAVSAATSGTAQFE